ncbi:MAG: ABC transporter ATP-binding protein [Candidatus Promineifilaceae bacterium]|nr:ABC transporter ATP-binding protein [Candidatus Promineifilaceae bacterium]
MTEFTIATTIETDRRSPARWLLSHILRHKKFILLMFAGAFGNAALAALVPILIGMAFNAVVGQPFETWIPGVSFEAIEADAEKLRVVGLAAVAIVVSQLVRAVLQLGRNFGSEIIGQRLERDTRHELYVSLLGKSMTFHDLQPVGDVMARATNDVREVNRLLNPGINLVIGSGNFLIMPLILAPTYHPTLVLAPAFFLVTYVLALARYLKVLEPVTDSVRLSFGTMNSRLAEAIDGIETVKGAAQERQEVALFHGHAEEYRNAKVEQGYIEARFLPLLLLGVTNAIGFTHAFLLYRAGEIQVGDIVAFIGLLGLFGFPTFVSLNAYSQVSLGMAGARRILALITAQTDLDENQGGYSAPIAGHICFEDVSFGYGEDTNVLKDVTLEVLPGETVAIVGQTGSGKSTLTKLINRTYDVREGQVLVDGVDVRDWELAALRRQISIIEQDIFLFSRTVAENIAFGAPDASREEIVAAAKAAQAHDFITSFKDGYDTVIGERGATLSGGQRQRLAIARAFLTDPRILILDDSTSAVDSATEDKIQRAIARAAERQTTILITHRLSQIRWADKVVLMRKGRLVAVGNHETLMAEHAAYRRIFEQYGEQVAAGG